MDYPSSPLLRSSSRLLRVGRALRHRNYRLFFFGQSISVIGTWLTRFAIAYASYEVSHSAFVLGVVAFCSQAPTAILAPIAGVYADRWDRRKLLLATQIGSLLQSAILAALALTHTLDVPHLLVLGAFQGVLNAFDMPARQSFVRQMVDDPADLPNAIALNTSIVNAARLIGPVVAAALVVTVGTGYCFALDSLSYVAVIASILMMRVAPRPPRKVVGRVFDEMLEGMRWAWKTPKVRGLLLLLATTSTFGGAYVSILPAVAEESLGGGAHTLGWLMASAGAGALIGVLALAARPGASGLGRVAAVSALTVGAGLVALEAARSVWVAAPIVFVVGMALIAQWTATNTTVQTSVEDDKLGRMMSLLALVFFAGAPLGSLAVGALASALGPIHALAIGGACCILGALAFGGSARDEEDAPREWEGEAVVRSKSP